MAIQIVQSKPFLDWTDFQPSWPVSFDNPTVAGNAIIAFSLGSNGALLTSLSDTKNTYNQDMSFIFGSNPMYFYSVSAAQSVQTLTFNWNISSHIQAFIMEVSGLQASGLLLDKSITNDNGYRSGGTWTSTAMATTTVASELLLGWAEDGYGNNVLTEDASWNVLYNFGAAFSLLAYRIVSATGIYTNLGTNTTPAGDYEVFAAALAYKGASGTADSVQTQLQYKLRIQ